MHVNLYSMNEHETLKNINDFKAEHESISSLIE